MIDPSSLTNEHLNGILHERLWGEEVTYRIQNYLSRDYEIGSEPLCKDIDFGWIPVANYSGDPSHAQFLRYSLAPHYNFILEPFQGQFAVTCSSKDGKGASLGVGKTEARATAVAIYLMIETIRRTNV